MLIIKLDGGLGNQMFQYAVASILAKKNKTKLLIDNNSFNQKERKEGFTPRSFELSIFDNTYFKALDLDISYFYKLSIFEKLKKKFGFNFAKIYNEKQFGFDDNLLSLNSPIYLNGYFQSYKYFIDYDAYIKEIFSFPSERLNTANKELLLKIKESNSISVHIRRGDYISDKITRNYHGSCSLDYYLKAISSIASKVNNVTLFFFSDDVEWVKTEFKNLPYPKFFIENNQNEDSWKDMYLMSLCDHNIIANSSFSWWGAWLNTNLEKIVIAPKNWFSDTKINTDDLIPSEWIRF